jgi:hypothetical protein
LLFQLAAGVQRPSDHRTAGGDDHVVPGGQNLRFAPLIARVVQQVDGIILASDKKYD